MHLDILNTDIKKALIRCFAYLDQWFDLEETGLFAENESGESSAAVLKQVCLENERMLSSIVDYKAVKGDDIGRQGEWYPQEFQLCLRRASNDVSPPIALVTLRSKLRDQLYELLTFTDLLDNDQGNNYLIKCKTTGTVILDAKQFVRAILLNMEQHIVKLEKLQQDHLV